MMYRVVRARPGDMTDYTDVEATSIAVAIFKVFPDAEDFMTASDYAEPTWLVFSDLASDHIIPGGLGYLAGGPHSKHTMFDTDRPFLGVGRSL